jgi:hypothetical protein
VVSEQVTDVRALKFGSKNRKRDADLLAPRGRVHVPSPLTFPFRHHGLVIVPAYTKDAAKAQAHLQYGTRARRSRSQVEESGL